MICKRVSKLTTCSGRYSQVCLHCYPWLRFDNQKRLRQEWLVEDWFKNIDRTVPSPIASKVALSNQWWTLVSKDPEPFISAFHSSTSYRPSYRRLVDEFAEGRTLAAFELNMWVIAFVSGAPNAGFMAFRWRLWSSPSAIRTLLPSKLLARCMAAGPFCTW
jgi:hypothetical protein